MQSLVVFSHLRWNFVYQRPQHLMSRLASQWRVVFVEEPMHGAETAWLEKIDACPNLQVWRPHLPGHAPGFHDEHLGAMHQLLAQALREERIKDYWLWFYTPMAYPLAAQLQPRGVVYDCMDELSAFKNAPRQLLQRENALLTRADLVFTGGPSLYAAKRGRHPSVHCFSSSVDAKHFTRAAHDHPLQAQLARPRLGWAGVIDERVDLELLAALADARPHWQIVMVGPIVKIDPASTPKRPNIHWLGQQAYKDLPAFISGWDVCLLSFALNDATRYISPTKTLEYMACGRPMVSTHIKDVVDPYSHVVSIAGTHADFMAACDAILARDSAQQAEHARALAKVVGRTSWDATAKAMAQLIEQADEEYATAVHAASTAPEVRVSVAGSRSIAVAG